MAKIQTLSPHLADLIAAGEVVERPASVVKELMENAIDAGCSAVTVEIQNGGMTLIRVTDDGCGIPPDEAATAFLRHATSKLAVERDLEAIGTLGFRGEALAAIAAVSRVELLTRTTGATVGTALAIEGGAVLSRGEAGCPEGSTLLVRNLFFNTPARLKFMKKDAAEGAAVFSIVQRLALSHPEVSVKFIRDGKQELLTPGDGALKSAVYSVLGRDIALGLLPLSGEGDGLAVSGFISLPACCRGSRGYQHFFVNGRWVKSRLMMAALEEAYRNQKMVGKFPACVLQLTAKLSMVDVNVHPTKTEVKFVADQRVFDVVYYAALSALTGGAVHPPAVIQPAAVPTQGTPGVLRDSGGALDRRNHPALRAPLPRGEREKVTGTHPGRETGNVPVDVVERGLAPAEPSSTPPHPVGRGLAPAEPSPTPSHLVGRGLAPAEPWHLIGETMQTYILVEQGDTLLLIDKHAAHERMEFDRLKAQQQPPMVQRLLTAAAVTLPPKEGAVLLERLDLLAEFGFEAEAFGSDTLLLRAVPADINADEAEETLQAIAARLLTTGKADPDSARDELLHTIACKAAIKGGQRNEPEELKRVAAAVLEGGVKYCPHGRPVAIELTRGQLEKQFKRT